MNTVYIVYILLTITFLYITPLWNIIIDKIENNSTVISILTIVGDSLYMIGGGIVASDAFTNGLKLWILINNSGIILIILGAIMREYFKKINSFNDKK
ncbi:hypothetical protein CP985_14380 [Malaciobacter mytili LMG 24559]|uniref:Uncharacterized protein n=1 Tax=Malaciobacter mytili LMG 24559 TaxID=1032238 RepID=A0AAX2AFN0_9BACT|nr:hypothetical protein [Malaciobacter mytili]AXH16323.1 putative membrane protein [Malaciobacter mytili LMG 24559]RXK12391.1 hypothetical protein CP985_14380 [Malaciobacter mytili LMG 24559]